jgi:hypothetical protein
MKCGNIKQQFHIVGLAPWSRLFQKLLVADMVKKLVWSTKIMYVKSDILKAVTMMTAAIYDVTLYNRVQGITSQKTEWPK